MVIFLIVCVGVCNHRWRRRMSGSVEVKRRPGPKRQTKRRGRAGPGTSERRRPIPSKCVRAVCSFSLLALKGRPLPSPSLVPGQPAGGFASAARSLCCAHKNGAKSFLCHPHALVRPPHSCAMLPNRTSNNSGGGAGQQLKVHRLPPRATPRLDHSHLTDRQTDRQVR